MAFLDINSLVKFKNLKAKTKIGKVINNNDPEKRGRIKVSLQGMFDSVDEEGSNLPWVKRCDQSFKGVHSFEIPEVGSLVEIVWSLGSRIPMYKPAPYDSNHMEQPYERDKQEDADFLFTNDYPNEWGWVDSNRFSFKINKKLNNFLVRTKILKITGDTEGNLNINNDKGSAFMDKQGKFNMQNEKASAFMDETGKFNMKNENVSAYAKNDGEIQIKNNVATITVYSSGNITVNTTGDITVDAPTTTFTNNVSIGGNLAVTGTSTLTSTCTFEDIKWKTHKHPYSWTDGAGSNITGDPKN